MTQRVVVVTGASGFFGRALCREFLGAGWHVRAGVRRRSSTLRIPEGCEPFACALPGRIDQSAFSGAEACIHAAYPMGETNRAMARRVAVGGTLAVLHECKRANVRPIFVSSCSAHEKAQSFYGRSKFHLEADFLAMNGAVLRPGFLLGTDGLFKRLVESVVRFPIVPMFDGGRQPVQTIPVELAAHGVRLCVEKKLDGRLVLAEPGQITMRDFFRMIADGAGQGYKPFPIPSGAMLGALKLAERTPFPLPITSENLLGWRAAKFQSSRKSLEALGLEVPPAAETVAQTARRCVAP